MSSGPALAYSTSDVEPAPVREDTGVDELVLVVVPRPAGILGHQVGIRKGGLGIGVGGLEVAVAGRGVEEPVQLLDVLAVVALGAGQAEQAAP